MKNVATGLIVMLVFGLALVGCDNPTEEVGYFDVVPVKDLTLSELIEEEGGAFFQNANNKSLRFFEDGEFQVFGIGLFMTQQDPNTYGSRYKVDGNTINIYRPDDTDDANPFYTISYTLVQHTLTIVSKTDGAGPAPNDTNLPPTYYSYGKLPYFRP
jgi:hypothetical protein